MNDNNQTKNNEQTVMIDSNMANNMPGNPSMNQEMPMGQSPMPQMGQPPMLQGAPMGQPGMPQGAPMGQSPMPQMGQSAMPQGAPMGQSGMPMGQPGMNQGGMGRPPRPPKPPKERKPMSKKTKGIIVAILAVIIIAGGAVAFLYFSAKKDKVDEEFLKANIPSELITYTVDGQEVVAEVDQIKITDQESGMYKDRAECEITFKDAKLTRELECTFESERTLLSKWKCTSVEYDIDDMES